MDHQNISRAEHREDIREFREDIKAMSTDFRHVVQEAIHPLVEQMKLQNGRISTLEQKATTWETRMDTLRWSVRAMWTVAGGGIVWLIQKIFLTLS